MDWNSPWKSSYRFLPTPLTSSWSYWQPVASTLTFSTRFLFLATVPFVSWFRTFHFGTRLTTFGHWCRCKTLCRAFCGLSIRLHTLCHWGIRRHLYRDVCCFSTLLGKRPHMRNDTPRCRPSCPQPTSLRTFPHRARWKSYQGLSRLPPRVSSWLHWRVSNYLRTRCHWHTRTCQNHEVSVQGFGVTIIWEVIRRLPFWLISSGPCFL